MDLISAIMSSPVIVVSPIDTLTHARHLLLRDKINRLVVVDEEGKPIGILTRGDMAREVSSRNPGPGGSFDQVLVREAMSKSPLTLSHGDTVLQAARTMLTKGISAVPVVDEEEKLEGIVSKSDLTNYYAVNCKGRVMIREVETRQVTTIPSTYTLYRAGELMRKNKIGRLIVVEGKTPFGIITQRDLSFAEYPTKGPQEKFRRVRASDEGDYVRNIRQSGEATVKDVMSCPPITIREEEDVNKAARLMVQNNIGGVPVLGSKNELSGIITKTDVAKALIIYNSRNA